MRAANLRPSRLAPLVLLAATACNQWDDRNRALEVAREVLGCFDVALEQTESHRFHAEGCGGTADVACSEGSLNPVCIRVAERGTSGGEAEREGVARDGAPAARGAAAACGAANRAALPYCLATGIRRHSSADPWFMSTPGSLVPAYWPCRLTQ